MTNNDKYYKTMQIWLKSGHRMYPYFKQMCENSKSLYNTTNFYIRQIYTALKSEEALQPLQQEVLDCLQQQIEPMNSVQREAYAKRVEREKQKTIDKQKEVKLNLFTLPSAERAMVDYNFLDALFKSMKQPDYDSLPKQSSQWVMKTVFQNWKSFFALIKDWKKNPSAYEGRPRIPNYSRAPQKEVQFTNQDCVIKEGKYLKFPLTKERLNIGKLGFTKGKLKQVRAIPKYGQYVVELIFEVPMEPRSASPKERIMSIDLGIDNLATITTNTGHVPVLLKGKHVKSINQYYNKQKARYISILRQGKKTTEGPFTSKRVERLHNIRTKKIKDIFHKASRYIVNLLVQENVDTLVIGQNKGWKQKSNIGKQNNQSFVHIPHNMFINMITYKAHEVGIEVIVSEESYTSKASFLDDDIIPTYGETTDTPIFSGKRISRGVYQAKDGRLINADVNGSANIMCKVIDTIKKETVKVSQVLTIIK
ncbi:RNA-guided endonuclease InsQ/TnpB family protein [Bacillus cereus]|uniref:RNA-guided endonuclease InsQ/TnpB family protein n=1 Tax=Bacillus cereus TaxID=1396 RepID=UPI000B4B5871|nr:RNA-guided endonuclease TnpB family protein [Bacillus cereus]